MNEANEKLGLYVAECRALGFADGAIYQRLQSAGWPDSVLTLLLNPLAPPVSALATPAPVTPMLRLPKQSVERERPSRGTLARQTAERSSSRLLLLVSIFLLLSVSALGWFVHLHTGASLTTVLPTGSATPLVYSGPDFRLTAPAGWTVKSAPPTGALVVFLSNRLESGPFYPNLAVSREGGVTDTLPEYVTRQLIALPSALANYQADSQTQTTLGGQPAIFISASYRFDNLELENLQLITLRAQTVTVLTLTVPSGKSTIYKPLLEQVRQSFQFGPPASNPADQS